MASTGKDDGSVVFLVELCNVEDSSCYVDKDLTKGVQLGFMIDGLEVNVGNILVQISWTTSICQENLAIWCRKSFSRIIIGGRRIHDLASF